METVLDLGVTLLTGRWEKLEVEPPEGQWTTKATVEQ
jgi:hypothetical protein